MSKEVRLNDKMWFGKYKGKTIKSVVDADMRFLEVLMDKGKISLHQNVKDYIGGGSSFKKQKLSAYRPSDLWWGDAPHITATQTTTQPGGWESGTWTSYSTSTSIPETESLEQRAREIQDTIERLSSDVRFEVLSEAEALSKASTLRQPEECTLSNTDLV